MANQLQTPLPTPVGQQVSQASPVTSPPAPGGGSASPDASLGGPVSPSGGPFKFGPRLVWVLGGLLLLVLIIAALVVFKGVRKTAEQQPAAEGEVSLPVPGVSPPALPPVEEEDQFEKLSAYFAGASTNFKEEFMDQVPQIAAVKYDEYLAAEGDTKLAAARAFYIYLNNPAVDRSDPAFEPFLADVKVDLEKVLGKPLF